MGGDADAVLRRAARFGDGWAPWLTKPDELPAKMDYLRSHLDHMQWVAEEVIPEVD
jgi:alkanesulfonate monooxygenase SsuD/methylene tetrahydromethanopterin reductase-like flavin-dependent oxidoreductase (luciferase family)